MLATSGKLDLSMHGPSVRQFAFKDDHSPIYDYARFDVDDPDAYRRSVYRFIVRSVPDPLMECLDCADSSLLTPKCNTTLTGVTGIGDDEQRTLCAAGRTLCRARPRSNFGPA